MVSVHTYEDMSLTYTDMIFIFLISLVWCYMLEQIIQNKLLSIMVQYIENSGKENEIILLIHQSTANDEKKQSLNIILEVYMCNSGGSRYILFLTKLLEHQNL